MNDPSASWRSGWCTYADDFGNMPDLEYFCGGINSKTPTAAALWRQGNLLHFGFEQSPAELNRVGQGFLLNAIAYISRFTEDRPIAITPSPFAQGPVGRSRATVSRLLQDETRKLTDLSYFLSKETYADVEGKDRAACRAWFQKSGACLHPDQDGKLTVDEDAMALGVPFDDAKFFGKVVAELRGGTERADRARRLLSRYAPEAPTGADAVATWWKEVQPYSFFSDVGDYRWYVDPLARKRGVPSAELRGPKRADEILAAGRQP